MDLAGWVAQGRVRGLLDLVEQLPPASRTWSAAALDEDLAEALLDEEEARRNDPDAGEPQDVGWRPPLQEWTLTAQMLGALIDEVKALRQATIAAAGGKPRHERPFPAPRTARAAVEARRDEAYAADLAADFGF